jgi:hypothetical protein
MAREFPSSPIHATLRRGRGNDGRVNMLVDTSEHKRAERFLARQMEGQAPLYQFTDRLFRAEALGDVFDAALDAIGRALDCQRTSILLAGWASRGRPPARGCRPASGPDRSAGRRNGRSRAETMAANSASPCKGLLRRAAR